MHEPDPIPTFGPGGPEPSAEAVLALFPTSATVPWPGPATPISPLRHWHHRHHIEAAFDRPDYAVRFDDRWFLSSEVAVELRRVGFDDVFDRWAELITRQRVGPGVEVLDVCWIVAADDTGVMP